MEQQLRRSETQHSLVMEKLEALDGCMSALANSGPVLEILREIRASMDQVSDAMKISHILDSLHFPSMDDRFRLVHDAAPKTFMWIFDDPDGLLARQPDLEIAFTEWLRSGSGIFHIDGKPGSGKSTLMKFICGNTQTEQLLGEWAGQRDLVYSHFFFWMIGSPEQKSLSGLVRAFLYAVIQRDPTLGRVLFPKLWGTKSLSDCHPWSGRPVQLTQSEVAAAFDTVIGNQAVLDKYRICFFIDGLDEFDETHGHSHLSLAQKLRQWSSGGHVKFCVSSRQLPVFAKTFSPGQRLTVQIFSREDIALLVRQKLEGTDLFRSLRQQYEERCDRLVKNLVDNAGGVFLWVTVLLGHLQDSLANDDPMSMLERTLDAAPTELDDFFHHIVKAIPQRYRSNAYCLLGLAMRASGILLSNNERSWEYKDFNALAEAASDAVSLIACSYLLEELERGCLKDIADTLPGSIEVIESAVEGRVSAASTRVAAQCRGLLECRYGYVVFTHRSIPEFLQRFFARNQCLYDTYVDDQSIGAALAWVTMIDVHYEPGKSWRYLGFGSCRDNNALIIRLMCRLRQVQTPIPDTVHRLLYSIDSRLMLWGTNTDRPDTVPNCQYNYGFYAGYKPNLDCLIASVMWGFPEYVVWLLENQGGKSPLQTWAHMQNLISNIVIYTPQELLIASPIEHFRPRILEAFFRHGLSPMSPVSRLAHRFIVHRSTTIWQGLLALSVFRDGVTSGQRSYSHNPPWARQPMNVLPQCWHTIELCLRFGADPRTVMLYEHKEREPSPKDCIQVGMKNSQGDSLVFPEEMVSPPESFRKLLGASGEGGDAGGLLPMAEPA